MTLTLYQKIQTVVAVPQLLAFFGFPVFVLLNQPC